MAHADGKITAPVDQVNDVPLVLGISSYDLGVQCTSNKINWWSKKKPVTWKSPEQPAGNWWKGQDNNCNIEPYVNTNLFDLSIIYGTDTGTPGMNRWEYIKPNSDFRLLDFEGYYHKAICPFSGFTGPTSIQFNSSGLIEYAMTIEKTANDNSLVIGDLDGIYGNFGFKYFGVYITVGRDNSIRATMPKTIAGTAGNLMSVELNPVSLNYGYATVIPFMCDQPIAQDDPDKVQNYYSIPGVNGIILEIIASYIHTDLDLRWVGNSIYYIVIVNNQTSSILRIPDGSLYFRYPNNLANDPQQTGETKMIMPIKSIPAKTKYSYPENNVDVSKILLDYDRVKIIFSIPSQNVNQEWIMYKNGNIVRP